MIWWGGIMENYEYQNRIILIYINDACRHSIRQHNASYSFCNLNLTFEIYAYIYLKIPRIF